MVPTLFTNNPEFIRRTAGIVRLEQLTQRRKSFCSFYVYYRKKVSFSQPDFPAETLQIIQLH